MIIFEREVLNDFERVSSLEWLETNGIGGWASSSLAFANTRRYHGMVVAADPSRPDRSVIVSRLDETVDGTFLGCSRFPNLVHPRGFEHLRSFQKGVFPVWEYDTGRVVLRKTVITVQGENTTILLYEILKAQKPFPMRFQPFLAGRDYHSLMPRSADPTFPFVNIDVPGSRYTAAPESWHDFQYDREKERGLDDREDLFTPGIYDVTLRKGDVIRIVGPAFSGSSLSMRQVIDHWRDSSGRKTPVVIVTGSASDESNLKTLTGDGITFSATVHTSSRLTTAAESLLTRRMDFDSSEIAILREGTTQYGRGQSASDTGRHKAARIGPLRVSFPMNISSLRAQYARHPQVQPATEGQTTPAGPRIPLDSREPATLTESPEVLSQLTPPAVEILFTQLERTLVAHHIRAVGILATDIRDQLFIADELRKRLRDVQLVFYGSNALLLRSEYSKSLIGSIVVSTYPLFLENQYWDLTKPEDDHERFVFMSDESQGVFNATLRQLGADDAMVEYAPPVTHSRSRIPHARPLQSRPSPCRPH